ncbi:hypothetical protein [Fibrella aquatilis]|uniref:Uncharacterized protein n=1 Tax=Fibrella aquatilis TaxID=2817059 RepID=A0A939G1N8_9BACT|nr:hypothetical protein [Fibrella aquatilis]MBO0930379.1 hypothetical protein [Fibrella aquatilis]
MTGIWKQVVDERGFQTMICVSGLATTTTPGAVRLGKGDAPGAMLEEWGWSNDVDALATDVATIELVSNLANLTFNESETIRANVAVKQPKEAGKGLSTNDYSTADKNKLAGIAPGATANSTDAQLLARANHTGSETITGGDQTTLLALVRAAGGGVLAKATVTGFGDAMVLQGGNNAEHTELRIASFGGRTALFRASSAGGTSEFSVDSGGNTVFRGNAAGSMYFDALNGTLIFRGVGYAELARLTNGRLLVGTTTDNGRDRLQVNGSILQQFVTAPADPTTATVLAGTFLVWKTTGGPLKLWANDGGTLKSVALT